MLNTDNICWGKIENQLAFPKGHGFERRNAQEPGGSKIIALYQPPKKDEQVWILLPYINLGECFTIHVKYRRKDPHYLIEDGELYRQ